MSGQKIETTKQALILFMKSLPSDCLFEVISFGTNNQVMGVGNYYVDWIVEQAINKISTFSANMGGTNILGPLKSALLDPKFQSQTHSKRVFVLTDGEVDNKEAVINLVKEVFAKVGSGLEEEKKPEQIEGDI